MARGAKVMLAGAALLAALVAGCGGGAEVEPPNVADTIELGSPFKEGGLATDVTCDGTGTAAPFTVSNLPPKTKSLAFVVEDPDAPNGTFTHWIAFNIPPHSKMIDSHFAPLSARNSAGKAAYEPPCPPKGDRPHRYVFTVYALKKRLKLGAGAD